MGLDVLHTSGYVLTVYTCSCDPIYRTASMNVMLQEKDTISPPFHMNYGNKNPPVLLDIYSDDIHTRIFVFLTKYAHHQTNLCAMS